MTVTVYRCQAILSIETVLLIEPDVSNEEMALKDSILQRAFELIDELLYQHEEARKNTEKF